MRHTAFSCLFVALLLLASACDSFSAPQIEPETPPDASFEALDDTVESKLDTIEKRALPDAGNAR